MAQERTGLTGNFCSFQSHRHLILTDAEVIKQLPDVRLVVFHETLIFQVLDFNSIALNVTDSIIERAPEKQIPFKQTLRPECV